MKDVLLSTLIDSFKLLPFLFITFLLIELFEHKFSKKSKNTLLKSGKFGPILGSVLGIIPQCGFSVAVTNLYITRIISLGTLFSIYLSTSDEMIPILLAEQAPFSLILKILIIKFFIGMTIGFIIDLFLNKKEKPKYEICNDEDCHCEKGIFYASLKHTFNIFMYIIICTLIINLVMHYGGEPFLEKLFFKNNILASFITSLIGLIPNCASSVILTELFFGGAISFGAFIGGLLSGSGLALLVLFKENKDRKENVKIFVSLYAIGVIFGILLEIIMRII